MLVKYASQNMRDLGPSAPYSPCHQYHHPSVDTVKNLLRNQILPARPERVTHIDIWILANPRSGVRDPISKLETRYRGPDIGLHSISEYTTSISKIETRYRVNISGLDIEVHPGRYRRSLTSISEFDIEAYRY